MKVPIKERAFTMGMVVLATIVVIVLAALQYRWSNQVSEATSTRLADSLQMSMINWHLDFFRDFSEICVAMREDPDAGPQTNWKRYVQSFVEWKKTTSHPDLVAGIYLLSGDKSSDAKAMRLDPARLSLESSALPPDVAALRQDLQLDSSRSATPGRPGGTTDLSAHTPEIQFNDRFYSGESLDDWQFDPRVPALVHPIAGAQAADAESRDSTLPGANWIVIALNPKSIRDQILPELAERYFRGTEGLDYQVAVIAGSKPGHLLYSSDPPFGEQDIADADGTMDIFGRPRDNSSGSPVHIFHAPSENQGPGASLGITWFPLFRNQESGQDWHLVLRHRRGGALGAFVADSRRRDLAISFGVLFLLVISIAILVITSTRAQRLAKLQMDFVTAVSHELRTPLTVINSAAENIAQGVVEGKEQLEQYGSVIGSQARKLFEMVEQILLFAAIREGHQRYTLRPVEVKNIVDAALSSTAGLIQAANFQVDCSVDAKLPQISGDLPALSQCLQNLITNALKYGSDKRWMGIETRLIEHGSSGKEIQIRVSDHGIGIDPQEMPHIFEPFYRSSSVTAAQIHGTGLGLPLAKSIVEAMKGQLTAKSAPGRGSTFTLHLPCIEQPSRQATAKTTQAVSP